MSTASETNACHRTPKLDSAGRKFDNGFCFRYNSRYYFEIFVKSAPLLDEGREEAAMKFSTDAKMKTLLQSPEAVAVLERYCPKILKNPVLQMTSSMTLRTVAAFA